MNRLRLFTRGGTCRDTTLAYQANYYPHAQLLPKHKIAWSRLLSLTKNELIEMLDEELTSIFVPGTAMEDRGSAWPIYWGYNCIPTEQEWNRMKYDSRFSVQLRVSGLIETGRAAVIFPTHLHF